MLQYLFYTLLEYLRKSYFPLLSQSYFGKNGLGQTILGSEKNIKKFTQTDIKEYMDKYYTADNVVISVAGNVDIDNVIALVEEYFANKFKKTKSAKQSKTIIPKPQHLFKTKKIEQTHISFAMKGLSVKDEEIDALAIANIIFGGGMSSRLFQKIREELGLCYSVYSYASQYKDNGILEIYAGVNTLQRDLAVSAILEQVKEFKKNRITEQEFARGKAQIKSAFIMGQESTASQMLLYAKTLALLDKEFDFKERINRIEKVSINDVCSIIDKTFDLATLSSATVGSKRSPLKI